MNAEIFDFQEAQRQKTESAKSEALQRQKDVMDEIKSQTKQILIENLERAGLFIQAEDARHQQEMERLRIQNQERLITVRGNKEIELALEEEYRLLKESKEAEHNERIDAISRASAEQRNQLLMSQVSAYGNFFGDLSTLFNEHSRASKAAAVVQGTISAIQTGINVAATTSKFLPPPVPQALGAAATLGQLAQVARMKSAGSFEQGGFIGGNSYRGDNLTANVNSGEAVLNPSQQREFMRVANGNNGGISLEAVEAVAKQFSQQLSSNNSQVVQNINVTGRVDRRTATQMAQESAKKQRLTAARVGT